MIISRPLYSWVGLYAEGLVSYNKFIKIIKIYKNNNL